MPSQAKVSLEEWAPGIGSRNFVVNSRSVVSEIRDMEGNAAITVDCDCHSKSEENVISRLTGVHY